MNKKIFLLGGFGDTAEITAEKLRQQFNNLTIEQSVFEAEKVMEKISEFQPCVLFVALNHPRAQKWIARHFQKMPSVKLAIGVGGAFDYISGKIKRAPQGMRYSFEWVFRLLMQPKRWKRIWNAVVRFPWMVFGNTLINTP